MQFCEVFKVMGGGGGAVRKIKRTKRAGDERRIHFAELIGVRWDDCTSRDEPLSRSGPFSVYSMCDG